RSQQSYEFPSRNFNRDAVNGANRGAPHLVMPAERFCLNCNRTGQVKSLAGSLLPVCLQAWWMCKDSSSGRRFNSRIYLWLSRSWATDAFSAESKSAGGIMRAPFLLGRMIFGGYFIFSGIHHFTQKR